MQCVICATKFRMRGNYNKSREVGCCSPVCRNQRKLLLQRARRDQTYRAAAKHIALARAGQARRLN